MVVERGGEGRGGRGMVGMGEEEQEECGRRKGRRGRGQNAAGGGGREGEGVAKATVNADKFQAKQSFPLRSIPPHPSPLLAISPTEWTRA